MKKTGKINVFSVIIFIVLTGFSLSLIVLLGWGLISSVKDPLADFLGNPVGFPKTWKFSNYKYVLENFVVPVTNSAGFTEKIGMPQQILNTILICTTSAFLSTFFPCLTGYVVAKYEYKFGKVLYAVALVVMMLPIIGAEASTLELLQKLHIHDTFFSIIFQRSAYTGLYFFVFEATFRAISKDFYEAASLDGASDAGIFFKIMFPMVIYTFLTVFMLIFIANWNDYQYPLMYLPSMPTLAYGLYSVSESTLQSLNNVPMRMAGSCILVFPIMVVFIIFKDRLMGNVSMGGLKE